MLFGVLKERSELSDEDSGHRDGLGISDPEFRIAIVRIPVQTIGDVLEDRWGVVVISPRVCLPIDVRADCHRLDGVVEGPRPEGDCEQEVCQSIGVLKDAKEWVFPLVLLIVVHHCADDHTDGFSRYAPANSLTDPMPDISHPISIQGVEDACQEGRFFESGLVVRNDRHREVGDCEVVYDQVDKKISARVYDCRNVNDIKN